MARKPNNPHAAGIYKRGTRFWLRFTSGDGEQRRTSLGTTLYEEAVKKAEAIRKHDSVKTRERGDWDSLLEKYLAEKQQSGRHTPSTSDKVRYSAANFKKWTGVKTPSMVTEKMLKDYYEAHRSKRPGVKSWKGKSGSYQNTGTAQGYLISVAAFQRWSG